MNRRNWLSALLAVMMVISMMACITLPAVALSDITQAEAEALPLASTATASDTVTKYQINSIDELLRTSHASVTSNPTKNGSTTFKTGDTIYITADLDLDTWDPSNFATYDESTGKYTTIGNFYTNVVNNTTPANEYHVYRSTEAGVECDTKEEVFAYLWNGFNARAALYTYLYADIDGLGHTISNLYTYCSFLVGDTYSHVSNLTFKNCTVESNSAKKFSGWTSSGSAILMRSTSNAGASIDNVHLIGCTVISAGGYVGGFVDLASNDTRPLSIVNCSMIDCTITVAASQQYQGLLVGAFRNMGVYTLENVLVYNSTYVAPTRAANHGILGWIQNGKTTPSPTLNVNNVAVIDCTEVLTTVDAAVANIGAVFGINQMVSSSTIDNVYYAGNTVEHTVKVAVEGSGTQMIDPETGEPMVDPETGEPVIDPATIEYNEVPTVTPVTAAIADTAGQATAAAGVKNGRFVTEAAAEGETVYAIKNLKSGGTSTAVPAENQVDTLDLDTTVAFMNETSQGGLWRIDGEGNPALAAGYALNISFIDPDATDNSYITHSFYTSLVTGKLAYNADFTPVDPAELDAVLEAADKTGMIPAGSTDIADVIAVGDGNWDALKDMVYDSSVSYEEIPYASRVYVNDGIRLYQIHNVKELVGASRYEVPGNKPYAVDKNGESNDHLSWIHLDDATCTSTSGGKTYKSSTWDVTDFSTYPKIVITDDLDVNDYTSDMWLESSYEANSIDADFTPTAQQLAFLYDFTGFMGKNFSIASYTSNYTSFPMIFDGLGHTMKNFYSGMAFIGGNGTGVFSNFNFENARVVSGPATNKAISTGGSTAIFLKGGSSKSYVEIHNVHIRDSYLEGQTEATGMGPLVGWFNGASRYLLGVYDCSVVNTHVLAKAATSYASVMVGRYGGVNFHMQNCIAVNNTLECVQDVSADYTPSVMAVVSNNSMKDSSFINVASIGNTIITAAGEKNSFGAVAFYNGATTPTITIDNIYAVNNVRQARQADGTLAAATPLEVVFIDWNNEFHKTNSKFKYTGVGGASEGTTYFKVPSYASAKVTEDSKLENEYPLVSTEADAIAKLNAQGQNYADWYKNAEGEYELAYAYNKTQDKYYDYTPWIEGSVDFDKVLAEAGANDTVLFGLDATLDEVAVEAGQTLDLQGNTLTVDSIIADGQVVDGGNGRGALKATTVQLAAENAQMALYDTAAKAYRLFDYELSVAGIKDMSDGDAVAKKFGFFLNFTSDDAYELLNVGAAAAKMTFTITLSGTDLGENLVFTFDDYLLGIYAGYKAEGKNSALTVNVSGMENLTDTLTVTASASSATKVAASAVNAY